MEFICSLFCSILCCIIFFGAIGGGIFFLLKQNKTQDTVKDAPPTADTKEQDEDIEEPVQPEEETAKVDAVTSEPAAEESSTLQMLMQARLRNLHPYHQPLPRLQVKRLSHLMTTTKTSRQSYGSSGINSVRNSEGLVSAPLERKVDAVMRCSNRSLHAVVK